MKLICGIKVPGIRIRIRKENKVSLFTFMLFCGDIDGFSIRC